MSRASAVSLATGSLLLAAYLTFVAASSLGRGTRPALGTPWIATSDSIRVQVYEQPGAETVVLLASFARPASDWNELAGTLAAPEIMSGR